MADKVLILASGLSAVKVDEYPYKEQGWSIYAVNNGWLAYPNFDRWVKAMDFRGANPENIHSLGDRIVKYTPLVNIYGGQVQVGHSITLTAGYCALELEKPTVMGFLGADMNYEPDKNGNTHIYGVGYDIKTNKKSDPDRMVEKHGHNKPEYLTEIYLRLLYMAAQKGCDVYNFSYEKNTRLPYPMAHPSEFE